MEKYIVPILSLILIAAGCNESPAKQNWQAVLKQRIPEYGHRNWIVIADSAYPKQSAGGIETIVTGRDQIEVLDIVLKELEAAEHIRPLIMVDKELEYVSEKDAAGITEYRKQLKERLLSKQIRIMSHEDIIKELDESSRMFNILLLKTTMKLPYTSVFLQLDCGYWNAEAEVRLRELFKAAKTN